MTTLGARPPADPRLAGPMRPRELTLRGLILGSLLTLIFTAANVDEDLYSGHVHDPVPIT
jgi:uncharacterized oligopeptide transporter (OPT) family protein